MIIYSNEESLLLLLSLIRGSRRRISIASWCIHRGLSTSLIAQHLNDASSRGIQITLMYNPCQTVDNEGLSAFGDGIVKIRAKSPTHTKIIIIDDLVISTDRNIGDRYYRDFNDGFLSCDLIFTSSRIADAVSNFISQGGKDGVYGYLDISDGDYRLIVGTIKPSIDRLLDETQNLRIFSGTFGPSRDTTRRLSQNGHRVIIGFDKEKQDFFGCFWQRAILTPGIISHLPIESHYKIIAANDFAACGSYNFDLISEVCVQDQMVFSKNPQDVAEFNGLVNLYDILAVPSEKAISLPLSPIVYYFIETGIKIYSWLLIK